MQIIPRQQAILNGMTWYFTGIPCCRNHVSKRNVKNGTCFECLNEKSRQARTKNPELVREKERHRYHKNVDAKRESQRISRERHIEKRREYDRNRYQDPSRREWQLSQAKQWGKDNIGKRREITKSNKMRLKHAMPDWLTKEMVQQIKQIYLLAGELGPDYHVDHIHPINGKVQCGLHVPWNLQILPARENIKKGNKYVAS